MNVTKGPLLSLLSVASIVLAPACADDSSGSPDGGTDARHIWVVYQSHDGDEGDYQTHVVDIAASPPWEPDVIEAPGEGRYAWSPSRSHLLRGSYCAFSVFRPASWHMGPISELRIGTRYLQDLEFRPNHPTQFVVSDVDDGDRCDVDHGDRWFFDLEVGVASDQVLADPELYRGEGWSPAGSWRQTFSRGTSFPGDTLTRGTWVCSPFETDFTECLHLEGDSAAWSEGDRKLVSRLFASGGAGEVGVVDFDAAEDLDDIEAATEVVWETDRLAAHEVRQLAWAGGQRYIIVNIDGRGTFAVDTEGESPSEGVFLTPDEYDLGAYGQVYALRSRPWVFTTQHELRDDGDRTVLRVHRVEGDPPFESAELLEFPFEHTPDEYDDTIHGIELDFYPAPAHDAMWLASGSSLYLIDLTSPLEAPGRIDAETPSKHPAFSAGNASVAFHDEAEGQLVLVDADDPTHPQRLDAASFSDQVAFADSSYDWVHPQALRLFDHSDGQDACEVYVVDRRGEDLEAVRISRNAEDGRSSC